MLPANSLYNIRVEHLTLIAQIEENEGELTPEIESALALTEEQFNEKAVSYGFVVKQFENTADIIDQEIKRLQSLKKKANDRYELFKTKLDEGMKQFKIEKIKTPTLSISYRKSNPIEVDETLQDSILKYIDVKVEVSKEKVEAAKKEVPEGEPYDPIIDVLDEAVECLKTKIEISKTGLGDALKQGVKIPGVKFVEKQNLQIK